MPSLSLSFSHTFSLSFSLSSRYWCNTNRYTDSRFSRITAAAYPPRSVSRLFVSFNRILVSRYAPRCISFPASLSLPHPRNLYFCYYWKSSLPELDENLFSSEARASLSLCSSHVPLSLSMDSLARETSLLPVVCHCRINLETDSHVARVVAPTSPTAARRCCQ